MIHFACADCGKPLQVSEDLAGKRVRCRHFHEPQDVPVPKRAEREPWFYLYVEVVAKVLVALTVVAALILLVVWGWVTIRTFVIELDHGQDFGQAVRDAFVGGLAVGLPLVGAVWTVFLLCFALLLIDMGRSLRAIRHNTEPSRAQALPD